MKLASGRGIETLIVDHHDLYSLYLDDRAGDNVEVTRHKPSLIAFAHSVCATQFPEHSLEDPAASPAVPPPGSDNSLRRSVTLQSVIRSSLRFD